jgi:uncharacterized alpha-E superfamily protein
MLSRVAETLYWMGRYIERAENTARLIKVNTNLTLDLPKGLVPDWEPLIVILGCDEAYRAAHDESTERRIVNFLVSDQSHSQSILASLAYARENIRTIRDILPREVWEAINANYQWAVENKGMSLARKGRHEYLELIMADMQRLTGLLAGSMNHDVGYDFLNMGRKLERADMTTRIIDVRSENTIPDDVPELRPFQDMLWMSMLKSLSAYQMYRQSMQIRINRDDVIRFLFLQETFPRSVSYCVKELKAYIDPLPNNENAQKKIRSLRNLLKKAGTTSFDRQQLHEYIDRIQLSLGNLHTQVAKSWFPA